MIARLSLLLAVAVAGNIGLAQPGNRGTIQLVLLEQSLVGNVKRVNFTPSSEGAILDSLRSAGFTIAATAEVPLVSKEIVEYSVVSTTGRMSALSGFVHLESGADGSLNFTSDRGATVVLKTEVNSISWIIDRSQAFKLAKDAKAKWLLFVDVEVQDITTALKTNAQSMGAQRSFTVTMIASLSDVAKSTVVLSHSGSVPRMSAIEPQAIQDGVAFQLERFCHKLRTTFSD